MTEAMSNQPQGDLRKLINTVKQCQSKWNHAGWHIRIGQSWVPFDMKIMNDVLLQDFLELAR